MNLIHFNGYQVDIFNQGGTRWDGKQEAWFIPKQVAEAIGASEASVYARNILNRNPERFEGFRGRLKLSLPQGGTQEVNIINENGLYMFLMASDLRDAIQFQRKVTHLLKRIRTGEEVVQTKAPASVEDMIIMQAQSVKELKHRQEETEKEVHQLKLVVDHEVWVTEHQKQQIRDAVGRRVFALQEEGYLEVHFQTIYSALKRHFGVAKYDKIPRKDFATAMRFVGGWYPAVKREFDFTYGEVQ